MKIELPGQVTRIIRQLNQAGFEAFAVGGCVRDSLLGKQPEDWDITTDAKPEQVKEIFRKTVDTGIQHGTVTVLMDGCGYEVTTYRIDGVYEDNRHPKEVTFTRHLEEDLKRRDFTINAMAYNDETGLVDCFSGRKDLKEKIIRCVGNPQERFEEDALRILRAMRFSSQLEFDIDTATYEAAAVLSNNLKSVSIERITVELIKLLMGNRPQLLSNMHSMGITDIFYPQLDEVSGFLIKCLKSARRTKYERLTALFIDKTEDVASEVLKNLKLDNETIKTVSILVRHKDDAVYENKPALRKMLFLYGETIVRQVLSVMNTIAEATDDIEKREKINAAKSMLDEIISDQDCVSYRSLALNGKDLLLLGVNPGKEVGIKLSMLMEKVLENPEANKKEYLISILNRYDNLK